MFIFSFLRALSRASSVASAAIGTPSICDQLAETLDTKQVQFCKKHPGFMLSVQTGASRAIDECKFQFRTRRWNCSTLDETAAAAAAAATGGRQLPTIVPLPPQGNNKKKTAKGIHKPLSNVVAYTTTTTTTISRPDAGAVHMETTPR